MAQTEQNTAGAAIDGGRKWSPISRMAFTVARVPVMGPTRRIVTGTPWGLAGSGRRYPSRNSRRTVVDLMLQARASNASV